MKLYLYFITYILFVCNAHAQVTNDCSNFKTGVFKLADKSVYTITRTENKQIENDAKTGSITQLDVKWITNCTYILYNYKSTAIDGKITELVMDTLYNEIKKINGNSYTVVSGFKKDTFRVEATLVKVDTSILFRQITDLPEFKKYDGEGYGGTLIDDNYSLAYRQEGTSNTYLLAFEEVYTINYNSQFKLLDNTTFTLKNEQHIATHNCRYNNKYDNEIVVIYTSTNDNAEAKIIRAWRFNRKTLKIEPIEKNKVQYKVADKLQFHW